MFSRSFTYQYSLPPLGNGRLIINGIRFCFNSISAITYPSITLSGTFTKGVAPELICFARCPKIRVLSYFVRKGIVLCKSSMIIPFLSLMVLTNPSISS